MKSTSGFRINLEYAAACFAVGVLSRLPRGGLVRLARVAAWIGWRVSGRLRRVGMANLLLAFPGKTHSEREAILKTCFFRFSLTVLDVFWFSRRPHERISKHVWYDESGETLKRPGAWVGVTGHFGHWELLGQAISRAGYRLGSVATPLKNPKVDELFIRLRQQTGQEILPQTGALRKMMQRLKRGHPVAILLDQNTLPTAGGIYVPFFGMPVPVSGFPASLILKNKTPVQFGYAVLDEKCDYRVFCAGVMESPEGTTDSLTRELTQVMEGVIRKDPASWLWMYKRWKLIPPESLYPQSVDRGAWPYYARDLSVKEGAPEPDESSPTASTSMNSHSLGPS